MSRLAELTRKVDAFFTRVAERHGTDMQCTTGCSDCCHVRLTITGVEAAAIREHVAAWPSERRRNLASSDPGEMRGEIAEGGDRDDIAGAVSGGAGVAGAARVVPRGIDQRREIAGIDRCAALDRAGRCKIYDARPLVCRSHGVPIRMRRGALPVVQACHRNFTRTAPDADCILDQTTLSATLLAVDAAEAVTAGSPDAPIGSGGGPGRRVELASLLADLAAI